MNATEINPNYCARVEILQIFCSKFSITIHRALFFDATKFEAHEMNTIKLFAVVVVIMTVDLNSSKVESAPKGSSGNEPSDTREPESDDEGDLSVPLRVLQILCK